MMRSPSRDPSLAADSSSMVHPFSCLASPIAGSQTRAVFFHALHPVDALSLHAK
jgi:hypothetical protein